MVSDCRDKRMFLDEKLRDSLLILKTIRGKIEHITECLKFSIFNTFYIIVNK